ncbi:DUF5723 family protein [Urechidicola vernalis]|uniref:DUF5723 family protein n=1 Tax=Urechidicola vernalis TaxID=3075600 RepID=A0ABU2Y305_9FLAO|nr:DUF5723 family protein [Urechidicola sp. P050]MDT0552592.1 DUF5723 family protein [Urechidicola sp. P050]
MNKLVLGFIFLLSIKLYSQEYQILYDFDEIPQTLILNPGSNYSHDYFIGIPILSGISLDGGVTGVTAYDIFADDGRDVNDKIRDVIYGLDNDDSFIINERVEVISGGIRLNENDFLSFGLYEEFDMVFYYPSDVAKLFYEGTTILNKQYSLDGINFKADMLGVLHAGISHKVNEKFTIGGRLKLYSSVFSAQTKNNRGEFYTTQGVNNYFHHHLINVDATFQTAGLIYDDNSDFEPKDYAKKIITFENPGFGLDIGFTHKINDQFHITGSILDIGFVRNEKDVSSYYLRGGYNTEGIEMQFDPDAPSDYWEELKEDFENKLPIDTLTTGYNSYRPIKFNASAKYSFGKPYYEDCFKSNANDPYRNAVGGQLFVANRLLHVQYAATIFYERRFGSVLRTKFTYTFDNYSSSNIGIGLSTKFGPVNLYLAADNIQYLSNLAKANSTAFQLGLNIIIDKNIP